MIPKEFELEAKEDLEIHKQRAKELYEKIIPETLDEKYGVLKGISADRIKSERLWNFLERHQRIQMGSGFDYDGFYEFAPFWKDEAEKKYYQEDIFRYINSFFTIIPKNLEIEVGNASKLFNVGIKSFTKDNNKLKFDILAGGPLQLSHEYFHVLEVIYRDSKGLEYAKDRTPQSEFFALFGELSYSQKQQKKAKGIEPLKYEWRIHDIMWDGASHIIKEPDNIHTVGAYLLQKLDKKTRKKAFLECLNISDLNENPKLIYEVITSNFNI